MPLAANLPAPDHYRNPRPTHRPNLPPEPPELVLWVVGRKLVAVSPSHRLVLESLELKGTKWVAVHG